MLEEVIIRTLAQWGLEGRRLERLPGVWVGSERPEKIAAIGARIERGITMHGFALNVDMDLAPFSLIMPCGLPGGRVTSMAAVLEGPVKVDDVARCLAMEFALVFGLIWTERHA
jgi:lipoate-protein ligase B